LLLSRNERAARLRAAFHGELHALRDGHFRQTLNQGLAPGKIGFNGSCGFRECGFVDEIVLAVKFVELILLLRRSTRKYVRERRPVGG